MKYLNINQGSVSNIEVIEKNIRCTFCNRLLLKLCFHVSIPPEYMDRGKFNLSDILPNLEMKFSTEIKCNRCKAIDCKITVI